MSHILNCFEITNYAKLKAGYRLVDVDGPFDESLGDGELAEANLQQLAKQLAFADRIPVAIVKGGAHPVLAIPADHELKSCQFNLAPDVAVLSPQMEEHTLDMRQLSGEAEQVALAFLGWHLRGALRQDHRLWNSDPWVNFLRRPVNYRDDNRKIDVFEGFGLRLRVMNGKPFVWVKVTHKYVESDWLVDVYQASEIQQRLRMRHVLYHYGHRRFPIQLLGPCGKSIREQTFIPQGANKAISIYDYTKREVGSGNAPAWIETLDPNSPALKYQYPGNQQKRFGAAALCKVMCSTDDPRVARLHQKSLLAPDRLIPRTCEIVREYLSEIDFLGEKLVISPSPMERHRKVFSVPAQEFGQGQTIHVGRDLAAGEVSFRDLGRKRMETMLDPNAGIAISNPIDAQYFVVPSSLAREVTEDLQSRFERTTRNLLHHEFQFERIVYRDPQSGKLKEQVDAIVAAVDKARLTSGRGVLVLPGKAQPDLHNYIKKKLRDRFQFQCLDANRISDFYGSRITPQGQTQVVRNDMETRFRSYLRYASLGLLLVNRQWPWVLAKDTHYDLYVGLDVLHSTAAFTFFEDGGRQCFMHSVESKQKEKLLRSQVRTVVYEQLKSLLKSGARVPKSIVLRRDGRSFAAERRGFQEAVQQLERDRLLEVGTQIGVVEVHKSTAEGFRIVEKSSNGEFRNPTAGTWSELDESEGLICTTGFPFKFPGTAKPLCVRIVAGKLGLREILEDTFGMSQLCWSAPDRCMRLSVDLKLCDDYLRSVAASSDDDEGQFGDREEEWENASEPVSWSA